MSRNSLTTKARISIGLPFAKTEISREWQDGNNNNEIHYGDQIAIRVCDGTYWQINRDNNDKVMALAKQIKEWEILEIVAVGDEFVAEKNRIVQYNDKIAFRFTTNNAFVGADLNMYNNELTAHVPWVKEWETFTLRNHPQKKSSKNKKLRYGSWFALQACNSKYVMFDRDKSKQLLACATQPDEWEAFVFIHPSFAK